MKPTYTLIPLLLPGMLVLSSIKLRSGYSFWICLLKLLVSFGLSSQEVCFNLRNIPEEWVACQQSWMYLEAIFSAADIQRQLPKESRMFLIVDKNWKEIMRNAYKMPLALPVMTDLKNYNTMKENNNYLDSITRCLEAYLEVKRMAFPR